MTDHELDILVAQHVFGMKCYGARNRDDELSLRAMAVPGEKVLMRVPMSVQVTHCTMEEHGWVECPVGDVTNVECREYSATGDGMLAVMARMRATGFFVTVQSCCDTGNVWCCIAHNGALGDRCGDASHPSAPRAVCLAALKALGVKVEP